MATFRIEILYDAAWKIFGFQVQQLSKNRDTYLARLKRRLGSEMTEKIVQHVEVSCGRELPLAEYRAPEIMAMPEFFELLGMERTLAEIERRIEMNAIFYDFHHNLLNTLDITEEDLRNLIDGQQSPGHISVENVETLMAMVRGAKQEVIGDADDRKFYRQRRRELIQFLQRALLVDEPLFCDV